MNSKNTPKTTNFFHKRHIIPKLRPDQRTIAQDAARFRVVACGRRWGKTTLGLSLAFYAAQAGRRVWWVAPTADLAFHPWRALKAAFYGTPALAHKLERERYIELEGGGSITVKSAHEPDHLRGVGLDLVIVDEAAFVDRWVWEAVLLPALADRQGRALIISTPKGRNWFWEAYTRGRDPLFPAWRAWSAPTVDNPRIPPEEVDAMRRILPKAIFAQEYEAEFLADGGEVFRRVREAATAPPQATPHPEHTYLMGVDFGRQQDFTACVVLDETERAMVALERFSEVSWRLQRERIAALARRWSVRGILAERNAMGDPNIEELQRAGLPVTGFTTTTASKGPLIEGLVVALENGLLRLLPDEVLLHELEAYTFQTTRSGHITYGAPPGGHDDTVMALALAWHATRRPRMSLGVAAV